MQALVEVQGAVVWCRCAFKKCVLARVNLYVCSSELSVHILLCTCMSLFKRLKTNGFSSHILHLSSGSPNGSISCSCGIQALAINSPLQRSPIYPLHCLNYSQEERVRAVEWHRSEALANLTIGFVTLHNGRKSCQCFQWLKPSDQAQLLGHYWFAL